MNDYLHIPRFFDSQTGFSLDLNGMRLDPVKAAALLSPSLDGSRAPLAKAHDEMQRLEAGAIKNPDENRQVTHFSDRLTYPASELFNQIEAFAAEIRSGRNSKGEALPFENVLINGIGGSALGPQLLQVAINGPYWNELSSEQRRGGLRIYFLDNTDAAGLVDALAVAAPAKTLVLTISKSGGTLETKNNMLALEHFYTTAGLDFAKFSIAITMEESALWKYAIEHKWLAVFPMAESIGGRTSETNIVGHLPAVLTGIDFRAFVDGARHMDELTRAAELEKNPAYQLALAWFVAGNGRGDRNMVVVPYSDRLVLLAKYLQQLVMESLGKEFDLDGNVVHQGLTVFGNKGGTDAHAYIQQLNDGRDDFFLTFIEIMKDAAVLEGADGFSLGEHLHAFKQGLATALKKRGRRIIQLELEKLDAAALGMLIAMYERAVAVYAELININAFHQPGVQAYKLASREINEANTKVRTWLSSDKASCWCGTAAELAAELRLEEEIVAGIIGKFAVNEISVNDRFLKRTAAENNWFYNVIS